MGMITMNFLFKNASVNTIALYIVYYSGLLLSFALRVSDSRKSNGRKVFDPTTFSFLCAALFSFPFVRVFLVKPESSWIFLSASKILLTAGIFAPVVFKKRGNASLIFLFSFLFLSIVAVVLNVKPVFLEIPSGLAFLTMLFFERKPLFVVVCVLFSISSFFAGKSVYLVHLALGGVFLAWHVFNETVEKQTSSEQDEDLHFILSKDMVHRLKNPLNAISVTAQLIRQKYPETSELASSIEKMCEKMMSQIEGILNPFAFGSVKRGELEEEMLPLVQLARIKGLEVELDLRFESFPIERDIFVSLVTNLFSNAVKYTEKGKVSLKVKREDDMIVVEVTDTGPGLKGGQRGMGLKVVEKLVEHLGGEMKIRVEGGTTVEIRIPAGRGRDVGFDRRG